MPMTDEELGEVIGELLRCRKKEKGRLDVISAYMANAVSDIYVPRSATREYRRLVDQARFNVLPLVVSTVAQALFVDGYRPTGPSGRAPTVDNAPIWDAVWQVNRMDARQAALYRPAITYGYSYALVLPGEPAPVITPYGPDCLVAEYEDPMNDEWPEHAMVCHHTYDGYRDPFGSTTVADGARVTVYDDEFSYDLRKQGGSWVLADDGTEEHGLGVVPVVRFLDEISGHAPCGKIEPLLPAQRQLNQTTFGLLMAQQYAAFKQRWVTGMAIAEDPQGNPVEPFNSAVNRLWQAESAETKFGEFGQTDLKGYLDSRDKTLLYISSVAQIPPHNLIIGGGISNISAEALVALEQGHRQDVAEHQTSFGESVEQMLRLAGLAMGDTEAWDDTSAQVVWRDTTPRSLAQVADALGKLATQLGIPRRALWERIPGVTDQDIARWEAMTDEQDLLAELSSMINAPAARAATAAAGAEVGIGQ